MSRILYIASLHHPEQLLQDQATAQAAGAELPLFPSSMNLRFWEKALLKRGHTVDVFWRNFSGFGARDIRKLQSLKYTNTLSPQRLAEALMQRLPYQLNVDLRRRNAQLIAYARQTKPDILWLIGDNRVIHADTLAQLKRELGCKILYSTGTSPIVFSLPLERAAARLYDLVIVNDFYHGIQWQELGSPWMLCLPAVAIDPEFHYPRPDPKLACDISFVGTLLPPKLYSERIAALEAIKDFDLGIWTVHDLPETLRPNLRGYALGDSMLEAISSSKMTLNVHGDFMRYGGNMRLFEAASVGTFQIVDERVGVHEWFKEGEHLVMYRSLADLRAKITYYLAHDAERQAIADAARQHVLKYHTYEQRLERLEEVGFLR